MTQLARHREQQAIAPQWSIIILPSDYVCGIANAMQMSGRLWPIAAVKSIWAIISAVDESSHYIAA
jgi:hypothetical protein